MNVKTDLRIRGLALEVNPKRTGNRNANSVPVLISFSSMKIPKYLKKLNFTKRKGLFISQF